MGGIVNRVSANALSVLSVGALALVLFGYTQEPSLDEGTLARLFQLTIAACLAVLVLFLVTADWQQPSRAARTLALPAAALGLAFGALYYLEHFYWGGATP